MSSRLELRIPNSSSANLPKALAIARTFDHFKEPAGRSTSYTLLVQDDELRTKYRDFEPLYMMTRGWQGTQLLINQRLADLDSLRAVLDVFGVLSRGRRPYSLSRSASPVKSRGGGASG